MTSRNYCFTAWKKPELENFTNSEQIKLLCYGIEKAPTTGKIHYQGYAEFKTPLRIAGVKKIMNDNTVHLEKRNGTRDQAINYCKKDGDFHILVDCPGNKSITQGKSQSGVGDIDIYLEAIAEMCDCSLSEAEKKSNVYLYDMF